MRRWKFLAATAALAISLATTGAQAQTMDRAAIRTAVGELADRMEASYVFPDIGRQYGATLRERRDAGAYDTITDPNLLAETLTRDLNAVHRDGHLRVIQTPPETADTTVRRGPPSGTEALRDERWLADGVAYLRIRGLPMDEASAQLMGQILDRFSTARTLILDLRNCPGGSLEVMDVLFSRLYAQPTELVTMDARTGANPELERDLAQIPSLRRADAPQGLTRFVHWATPSGASMANTRVYVLTGRTGSACEHLALALKTTGRGTLVGRATDGANHFGGEQSFGNGRFQVWLPVGRTFVAATNQDWEGVGVAPDREVPPDDALNVVLREIGVPESAAASIPEDRPPTRRVEATPGRPGYGIAMRMTPGAQSIEVADVIAGGVAERAGVRAGDRIVSVNGAPVSQLTQTAFGEQMRASPLTLVVNRGGEDVTVQMRLEP